jgi:glucose/arabinose dehydrogenase
MLPIASGLSDPHDITCSPDGRLYVNEPYGPDNRSRIVRFNQDGSGRMEIAEWPERVLRPSAMVFAPNGDLYFGTALTQSDGPTKGVWRISGALQTANVPEQILPPEVFSKPGAGFNNNVSPYAFLTAGPFAGDLLIVDVGSQGRVLRAAKPDFKTLAEFIPAFKDAETSFDFRPAGLAINSKGDVFVNDFTNDKVLRYGPDGSFKGVIAKLDNPNQIAIGPDDMIHVTNAFFPGGGGAVRGGLFIFDAEGKPMASASFPLALRGVTVCAP